MLVNYKSLSLVTLCPGHPESSAVPASLRWTAPEILENPTADESSGEVFTPACDVYSYAMVIWEVINHADPFDDVTDENEVICFSKKKKKKSDRECNIEEL